MEFRPLTLEERKQLSQALWDTRFRKTPQPVDYPVLDDLHSPTGMQADPLDMGPSGCAAFAIITVGVFLALAAALATILLV